MIKSNSSAAFPGKLGNEFRKLWAAIQALQPIPTPGVRVQQTTRGVALEIKQPAAPGAVEEMTFVREFDDFLQCTDSGGATVYVWKPKTLRASQWNPGWDFTSNWGAEIGGGKDNSPNGFVRPLRYIAPNLRYRFKVNRENQYASNTLGIVQFKTNDTNGVPFRIAYQYVRELIWPPYHAGSDYLPGGDLNTIYALKLKPDSLRVTTEERDTDFNVTPGQVVPWVPGPNILVPAGLPITHVDLNNDARAWQTYMIGMVNVFYLTGDGNVGNNAVFTVEPVDRQFAGQDIGSMNSMFNKWHGNGS